MNELIPFKQLKRLVINHDCRQKLTLLCKALSSSLEELELGFEHRYDATGSTLTLSQIALLTSVYLQT